jgi:hypothetical protein
MENGLPPLAQNYKCAQLVPSLQLLWIYTERNYAHFGTSR